MTPALQDILSIEVQICDVVLSAAGPTPHWVVITWRQEYKDSFNKFFSQFPQSDKF